MTPWFVVIYMQGEKQYGSVSSTEYPSRAAAAKGLPRQNVRIQRDPRNQSYNVTIPTK